MTMAEQHSITFARFQQLTLESADAEGRVVFPQLRDWGAQTGWVLTMYWNGLIERTGPEKRQWEKSGPWVITDKGRAAITGVGGTDGEPSCAGGTDAA